jgi:hypothetical protein
MVQYPMQNVCFLSKKHIGEIFKIQAASNSVGLTKHINISHLFKASFERVPQIIGIQSHHILLSIILFLEERIIDKLNKTYLIYLVLDN